jgi:transcriptional regulator with GAF, ATPase, and Fis domain
VACHLAAGETCGKRRAFFNDTHRETFRFANSPGAIGRVHGVPVDLTLLPPILLALAEQRSLDAVLTTIVGAVAAQPEVALARVWLRDDDRACPVCLRAGHRSEALHLRASAGSPLDPAADWSKTTGSFHRVPLDAPLKIAHIAKTGQPVRISRLADDSHWIRSPQWAAREGLKGFAGRPLMFRGEVLGVLAAFRRTELSEGCWTWLQTLSDAASVAVANARAFEDAERLRKELELERDYLREEVQSSGAFGEILGQSPALGRVLHEVNTVAATDTAVLILGESGTGKELVARAIHQRSRRASRPMVKVNCGSIPRELFESEFFGHVRGSFTGAVRDRVGRFQLANGGTIFLDEVGEIPLDLQVKLLRVLQEGEFERLGDETTRRVDVRIIAATNRDLQQDVIEHRFRLDLFYRLSVFPIATPPLRDRRDDIPQLIQHFVHQCSDRLHVERPKLPIREIERAQAYDWPGNIRELQNVVERAVILARGGALELLLPNSGSVDPSAVPPVALPASTKPSSDIVTEQQWRDLERTNVRRALERANFRIYGPDGAAALLGINGATLASRLKKLGVTRATGRAAGRPDTRPGLRTSHRRGPNTD